MPLVSPKSKTPGRHWQRICACTGVCTSMARNRGGESPIIKGFSVPLLCHFKTDSRSVYMYSRTCIGKKIFFFVLHRKGQGWNHDSRSGYFFLLWWGAFQETRENHCKVNSLLTDLTGTKAPLKRCLFTSFSGDNSEIFGFPSPSVLEMIVHRTNRGVNRPNGAKDSNKNLSEGLMLH